MKDWGKFRLKAEDELTGMLADIDNIFVIACNKCFKEFETLSETDCETIVRLAEGLGKTVTGTAKADFLCNENLAGKILPGMVPAGTGHIVVAACGLGIQTVADLTGMSVFAAADSVNPAGHHGMALTEKACNACAQCYLNITGGICPIVDCSKSLLNGQCGGAKNGKCEADPNQDCAWQKIQERLAIQGRLEELQTQPVQIRDYSKINHKLIHQYVKTIREKRLEGFCGGVHPPENKERTAHLPIVCFPEPDTVAINLSQHAGTPANCIVRVGDHVDMGQKIGEASGPVSASIHSSVSGTVIAIEERMHATRGEPCLHVVIENDKKNTLHPSIRPHPPLEELTPEEIIDIVREAGIVGMGGAGFPMSVKLMPTEPIDTVLLNGCECEPLLTADHRVLLEQADDVIFGLQAIIKAVHAQKGIIVIEDNKPDAIERIRARIADMENMEVCVVRTKYPQGAEKMLIKRVLGRQIPHGGLPADAHCVVANVSTAKAISDAIRLGIPVMKRVVTVTGDQVKTPGNFLVKIGTDIGSLLAHCGGTAHAGTVVRVGGPMMGTVQSGTAVSLTKCSNGIIAMDADEVEPQECIRCGRCVDVCPMELKPLNFAKLVGDPAALKEQNITDCVECGCCAFICSSKIPLVQLIHHGKNAVREMK